MSIAIPLFCLLYFAIYISGKYIWKFDNNDVEPFWSLFCIFCSFIIVAISFLIYFAVRNNPCI